MPVAGCGAERLTNYSLPPVAGRGAKCLPPRRVERAVRGTVVRAARCRALQAVRARGPLVPGGAALSQKLQGNR